MVRGMSCHAAPSKYCQLPCAAVAALAVISTPTRASLPLGLPTSFGSVKPGKAVDTATPADGTFSSVKPSAVSVVAPNNGASLIGVTAVVRSTVAALYTVVPPLAATLTPANTATAPPELSIKRVVKAGAGVAVFEL